MHYVSKLTEISEIGNCPNRKLGFPETNFFFHQAGFLNEGENINGFKSGLEEVKHGGKTRRDAEELCKIPVDA